MDCFPHYFRYVVVVIVIEVVTVTLTARVRRRYTCHCRRSYDDGIVIIVSEV